MKFTLLIIGAITIVLALITLFLIPFVDEFETFNCIATPCDMPKITIAEKIAQSLIWE